jgi:hypothetical protein
MGQDHSKVRKITLACAVLAPSVHGLHILADDAGAAEEKEHDQTTIAISHKKTKDDFNLELEIEYFKMWKNVLSGDPTDSFLQTLKTFLDRADVNVNHPIDICGLRPHDRDSAELERACQKVERTRTGPSSSTANVKVKIHIHAHHPPIPCDLAPALETNVIQCIRNKTPPYRLLLFGIEHSKFYLLF